MATTGQNRRRADNNVQKKKEKLITKLHRKLNKEHRKPTRHKQPRKQFLLHACTIARN